MIITKDLLSKKNYIVHYTVYACLLFLFLLSAPQSARAELGVGMEANTAFTDVFGPSLEYESRTGELLRISVPVTGDGIKVTWRRLLATNGFAFYAGPEILVAEENHNLSGFGGYGFSYVVNSGPAHLGLHASLGLAEGKALTDGTSPTINLGGAELHLTTLTSLGISILF